MMQEPYTRRRKVTKGIPWMTELKDRCEHPAECLKWRDNAVMFAGFGVCEKCGDTFCRDDMRGMERLRAIGLDAIRQPPYNQEYVNYEDTVLLKTKGLR